MHGILTRTNSRKYSTDKRCLKEDIILLVDSFNKIKKKIL